MTSKSSTNVAPSGIYDIELPTTLSNLEHHLSIFGPF